MSKISVLAAYLKNENCCLDCTRCYTLHFHLRIVILHRTVRCNYHIFYRVRPTRLLDARLIFHVFLVWRKLFLCFYRGTTYIHIHEEQSVETYLDRITNFSYSSNSVRKVIILPESKWINLSCVLAIFHNSREDQNISLVEYYVDN